MSNRARSTTASIVIADPPAASLPAPVRPRKAVSAAIVTRLLAVIDGIAILLAGFASLHWGSLGTDFGWRTAGVVVALGAVLGVNFLHLLGAYKFDGLGRLVGAVAAVAGGWLMNLGTLMLVASLAGLPAAVAGHWLAVWFAGGFAAL